MVIVVEDQNDSDSGSKTETSNAEEQEALFEADSNNLWLVWTTAICLVSYIVFHLRLELLLSKMPFPRFEVLRIKLKCNLIKSIG